jgi:hypothetical protein
MNSVTVKIHLVAWGEEVTWKIDNHNTTSYTNEDNGNAYFYEKGLSNVVEKHTFSYADSWGDGWHGGYWQIIDGCGGTIAGGAKKGLVVGEGGAINFTTTRMCCSCADDPDGVLMSLGTSCTYWMGLFENDCNADVSTLVDQPGSKARDVCPVTCGDCNTKALNTTKRTCGRCPYGYTLNEDTNTYEDLDECALNNGGCDPLIKCFNSQGSHSCDECPEGFTRHETYSNAGRLKTASCTLPPLPEDSTSANVQPKLTFDIDVLQPTDGVTEDLTTQIRDSISQSLSVVDSQFDVSFDTKRRIQDAAQRFRCIVIVLSTKKQILLLDALMQQLADANSPLATSMVTKSISIPPQTFDVVFQCPKGTVMLESGTCARCPPGEFAPQVGSTCRGCPKGETSNHNTDACICANLFYNSSTAGHIKCHKMDYSTSSVVEQECVPCGALECVEECQGDAIIVTPGWMLLQRSDSTVSIFECRTEDACPGGFTRGNQTACEAGYQGTLCGECVDGYKQFTDGGCIECGLTTWVGVISLFVVIGLLIFLASKIKIWYHYFAYVESIVDTIDELQVKAIAKIVVATMQIISNLGGALNVEYPEFFKEFVNSLGVFKFDVASSLGVGCLVKNGIIVSLITNFLLVGFTVLALGLSFLYQSYRLKTKVETEEEKRSRLQIVFKKFDKDGDGVEKEEIAAIVLKLDPTITSEQVDTLFEVADKDSGGKIEFEEFYDAATTDNDAVSLDLEDLVKMHERATMKAEGMSKFFLLIFLMYPSVTNRIFDAFPCRNLGYGSSVLLADYKIHCEDDVHTWLFLVSLGLVLLWPIGLPAFLLYTMYTKKALLLAKDEDTMAQFDFVVGDYKIEYWYWEIIEFSRKLVLAGLISLVGRGTVGQAVLGTVIAFGYFAAAFRERPYNSTKLNRIKIFTEIQLFGILLVCTVLQTFHGDFGTEYISINNYGVLLTALTVAILPISLWFMWMTAQELKEKVSEDLMEDIKDLAGLSDDEDEPDKGFQFDNPVHSEQ